MNHESTIQFLGAAETVTGSKRLLKAGGKQVLLDCGLFQGLKQLRLRNRQMPPFSPSDIDAVVLSHAQIDQRGYPPLNEPAPACLVQTTIVRVRPQMAAAESRRPA